MCGGLNFVEKTCRHFSYSPCNQCREILLQFSLYNKGFINYIFCRNWAVRNTRLGLNISLWRSMGRVSGGLSAQSPWPSSGKMILSLQDRALHYSQPFIQCQLKIGLDLNKRFCTSVLILVIVIKAKVVTIF